MKTYIYWLFDLTKEGRSRAFYCGKTTYPPRTRLNAHVTDARREPDKEKSQRILNALPHLTIHVMEVVPPGGDWVEREKRWISILREMNPETVNKTAGGQGATGRAQSELQRRRVLERQAAKRRKMLQRLRISAAIKQLWQDPEHRMRRNLPPVPKPKPIAKPKRRLLSARRKAVLESRKMT